MIVRVVPEPPTARLRSERAQGKSKEKEAVDITVHIAVKTVVGWRQGWISRESGMADRGSR